MTEQTQTTTPPATTPVTDRRTVLMGGATAAGAAALLAACGGSGGGSSAGGEATTPAAGTTIGKTSDVPVGGGTVFQDAKVVVTQTTKGDYKAFSAVCTHQGCLVSDVSSTVITCNCHGSEFSVKDGSVVKGPATKPLAEEQITESGGEIKTA